MGTIITRGELVMVDFMCHFDWAMGAQTFSKTLFWMCL